MNSSRSVHISACISAIAAVFCIVAPGCKSHGSNQELLERELRCQEDRIYQLEDELDEACYALESSRRENESLKKEVAGGDKGAGGRFTPSVVPPSVTTPPLVTTPDDPTTVIPDDAPPLELPKEDAPPYLPKSKSSELDEAPPFQPPQSNSLRSMFNGETKFQPASLKGKPLTGDPNAITRLAINRQLTGGWNNDGHHGDEGVFVAFEPRDAANKLVEAAGEISIVVLDPTQTGAAARVARWDFATDEAELNFRTGPIGRGFQFELPWPSKPPTSRDLRLFIRMSTPDGRQVETDSKIRITPCESWTAKTTPAEPVVTTSPPNEIEPEVTARVEAITAPAEVSPPPTPPRRAASRLKRPRPWSPTR